MILDQIFKAYFRDVPMSFTDCHNKHPRESLDVYATL